MMLRKKETSSQYRDEKEEVVSSTNARIRISSNSRIVPRVLLLRASSGLLLFSAKLLVIFTYFRFFFTCVIGGRFFLCVISQTADVL